MTPILMVKSYGFRHETLRGQQILDQIRPVVESRCYTFVDSVTRVADDHVTPVEKLWITATDDGGAVLVYNHAEDVWALSHLTET